MKQNFFGLLKLFFRGEKNVFPQSNNISVSPDFQIGNFKNIQIEAGAIIAIESGVCFREFCNLLVFNGGKLKLEANVFFNNYCSINCLGSIEIGANTLFGEGVKIYDHNHKHQFLNDQLEVARNDFSIGSIIIGKNCWIGSNVTILKDVEIGDNVIIGANCLIFKSIPSNTVMKSKVEYVIK